MPATYQRVYDRKRDLRELEAQLDEMGAPEPFGDEDFETEPCYGCGYAEHECSCDEDPDLPDAMIEAIERHPDDEVCLCACCREMLYVRDELADNPVYKCGELSYVELAHRRCAVADNLDRDAEYGESGWRWRTD